MSVIENENKRIVDFICYLSTRFPDHNIIDSPSSRRIRVENPNNGEIIFSYSYSGILKLNPLVYG